MFLFMNPTDKTRCRGCLSDLDRLIQHNSAFWQQRVLAKWAEKRGLSLGVPSGFKGYSLRTDALNGQVGYVVEGRATRHMFRIFYPVYLRSKVMRGNRWSALQDALDLFRRMDGAE